MVCLPLSPRCFLVLLSGASNSHQFLFVQPDIYMLTGAVKELVDFGKGKGEDRNSCHFLFHGHPLSAK